MIPPFQTKKALIIANVDLTHGETTTAEWDCKGGSYATIDIVLGSEAGAGGTGPTIQVEDGDTSGGTFATVVANRTAEDVENERLVSYFVDLRGKKRYLKLTITVPDSNTNSNMTVAGAVGTLYRLAAGPTNTADILANTSEQAAVIVG